MAFAKTEPLRQELAEALPKRAFTVRFWDGTELPATNGDNGQPTSDDGQQAGGAGQLASHDGRRAANGAGPVFTAKSPKAIAHLVRAPSELGLGRAYVSGELEVDDLDKVVGLMDTFEAPRLDRAARVRLALAGVRACGLTLPPRAPKSELRPHGKRHSRERDARAVRHHYDMPGDFFKLFLDGSMTYSCAIFSRGATTLEEAQRCKLDLVCTKLGLKEGERVLDVGCGWGAFAIHAAKEYGADVVGITLSPPQAEVARRCAAEAGVSNRVEIRVADYRDPQAERYDAIASIGMVEHVGEANIDLYAKQLRALLKDDGRLLNHGIARLRDGEPEEAGAFTQRFVFPDGVPLQLSHTQLALERAGFVTEHVEGFGDDYYTTLTHWIERLDSNRERAQELAGDERLRVWRLYLRGARDIFRTQFVSIYQTLARVRRS